MKIFTHASINDGLRVMASSNSTVTIIVAVTLGVVLLAFAMYYYSRYQKRTSATACDEPCDDDAYDSRTYSVVGVDADSKSYDKIDGLDDLDNN